MKDEDVESEKLPKIIDERVVATTISAPLLIVERLLIELVAMDVLSYYLEWICPKGGGVAWSGSEVKNAPHWITCRDCREEHFFDEDDVEVHFRMRDHSFLATT